MTRFTNPITLLRLDNVTGQPVMVSETDPLPITNFYQQVAEGLLPSYSNIIKLGFNAAISTSETLISGTGGAVPYMPTAAVRVEALSADVNDTAAGSGARSILVSGLDAGFNEISELLTMNGVTPVASVQSFIRLNTAIVTGVGTYRGVNVGTITVRQISAGTTFVSILAGQATALTSHFIVPAGKTAYIHSVVFTVETNKSVNLTFWLGSGAGVVAAPFAPVLAVGRSVGLNSVLDVEFGGLSGLIPEKTDLYVTAAAATATAGVTAQVSYIMKTT